MIHVDVRVLHVDSFELSTYNGHLGEIASNSPQLDWEELGGLLAAIYDLLLLEVHGWPPHLDYGVKWWAHVMMWDEDKTHNMIVQKVHLPM